jgi:hypothetical protein
LSPARTDLFFYSNYAAVERREKKSNRLGAARVEREAEKLSRAHTHKGKSAWKPLKYTSAGVRPGQIRGLSLLFAHRDYQHCHFELLECKLSGLRLYSQKLRRRPGICLVDGEKSLSRVECGGASGPDPAY